MISKNKIIALILGVSLASSATYGSYAYFKGEYSVENTIKIVSLDKQESPFEVSKISIEENSLVLEFSKRIFFSGDNLKNAISGSNDFLGNAEILIDGNKVIVTKSEGTFLIPIGIKNNLPSIILGEGLEDRFGKKLEQSTLYLYSDNEGNINISTTNEFKGENEIPSNEEINNNESLETKPDENNNESGEVSKETENNEPLEENSLSEKNNTENIEIKEEKKDVINEVSNIEGSNENNKDNNIKLN